MATYPKLVNKQFNSPINLYSNENIRDVLERETQMLANGAIGINFHKPLSDKPANLQNSAVLRLLEEEEQRKRSGQPPSLKRVTWPPPPEAAGHLNQVSAQDLGETQKYSPGVQHHQAHQGLSANYQTDRQNSNYTSPRSAVYGAPFKGPYQQNPPSPNYQPATPARAYNPPSPTYQQQLSPSRAYSTSPSSFYPQSQSPQPKGWAPVHFSSPTAKPYGQQYNQSPVYSPNTQHVAPFPYQPAPSQVKYRY